MSYFPLRPLVLLITIFGLSGVGAAGGGADLLVERTVLPEAAPSSFAIGLPGGVSFCYDPVRGGLDYIWTGGFVDIASVRPGTGKQIAPVTLLGPVVYRESGMSPLRPGDPSRSPALHFLGYRFHPAAIEFRYTVDGIPVNERISLSPSADRLVRRFRIEATDAAGSWWYVPGSTTGGTLSSPTGAKTPDGFRFTLGADREFVLEVALPPTHA